MSFDKIRKMLDTYREEVIYLQKGLVAIPALSPTYNPPLEHCGETRKVEFIKNYLSKMGIVDFTQIDAKDSRVPSGVRPNLVARIKGKDSSRTVWVMAHTDVVPPGDMSMWGSNPFEAKVDGDKIIGRGVEDNHQGLVAGIMAARAIIEARVTPKYDLALLFVADEEAGSEFGIQYVLNNDCPFKRNDLIVVPDSGVADGSDIEIAEKGIAWVKFEIKGKQTHASSPNKGNNAMRAGAHLIVALDELRTIFDKSDSLFDPPTSTFEPTKKEPNVPNINTIPGSDVFYMDCRVLPEFSLGAVKTEIDRIAKEMARKHEVEINASFEHYSDAAPATEVNAPVVELLTNAVKEVYGVDARPIGIGGGTVAAYLREAGFPCAVWSKIDETMHGPNEYAKISNIVGDAKVIARLAL